MNKKNLTIGIIALLIIGLGIFLFKYTTKPLIDTSTPETTISSLIANYDYVKDPSEVTALGRPYPEEVDVVVL
jgi:divalent metal cation (Fe/Co/Zn/Cd) transporter